MEGRAFAEIGGAGEVVNSTTVFTESETAPITSLKMFTPTASSSSSASSVQVSTPEGVSIPAANTTYSAGALSTSITTTTGKAEAAASPTASASVMGGARRCVDLSRGAGWVVGAVLGMGGLAAVLL